MKEMMSLFNFKINFMPQLLLKWNKWNSWTTKSQCKEEINVNPTQPVCSPLTNILTLLDILCHVQKRTPNYLTDILSHSTINQPEKLEDGPTCSEWPKLEIIVVMPKIDNQLCSFTVTLWDSISPLLLLKEETNKSTHLTISKKEKNITFKSKLMSIPYPSKQTVLKLPLKKSEEFIYWILVNFISLIHIIIHPELKSKISKLTKELNLALKSIPNATIWELSLKSVMTLQIWKLKDGTTLSDPFYCQRTTIELLFYIPKLTIKKRK